MGNLAGVQRDFQALEQRRLQAARLLKAGVAQSEVARQVGAHRQSVSRWAQQLEQGGLRALKKAGRAGRRPRLHADDLRRIEKSLKRGPEVLGYETGLWTSWRVAHLIEHECGVKYHPSQAWRILRQLGWSCQRLTGRALERDEEKIRVWKRKRWPEITKSPDRREHHRLHRRKRTERAAAPLPYLGAAGTDAGAAISLQLEDAVGDGGCHVVELLLSALSRRHPQPADHRVSQPSAASHSRQTAARQGRVAGPPQLRHVGVHTAAEGAPVGGVSSRLRARTESGRISVVVLETA